MEAIHSVDYDTNIKINIVSDIHPTNPRKDYDNAGTMVCWHGRYTLGDEQPKEDSMDYRIHLAGEAVGHDVVQRKIERIETIASKFPSIYDSYECYVNDKVPEYVDSILNSHYVILPLYLYDHGGITMSTGGFSCPWDSGQVGFIYISKAKAIEEWGKKRFTKSVRDRAVKYLEGEVEEYDLYLTGQCYGFVIETPDDDHAESCWGFLCHYDGYILDEAKEAAKYVARDYYADTARIEESERPDMYA